MQCFKIEYSNQNLYSDAQQVVRTLLFEQFSVVLLLFLNKPLADILKCFPIYTLSDSLSNFICAKCELLM